MNLRKTMIGKSQWLCTGVLAMGMAGTGASLLRAAPPDYDRSDRAERLNYDDLPWRVMDTLDNHLTRHNRLNGDIEHVRRGDQDFYRATLVNRDGGDRQIIRIDRTGRLLDEREVDARDVTGRDSDRRDADRRGSDRAEPANSRDRFNDDDRVTASVKNPERIDWEQIPGRVRAVLGREAEGQKVDFVVRYRDQGHVIYQTNVPDGRGHSRLIQVLSNGELFGEASVSNGSGENFQRYSTRQPMTLRDVPREARRALEGQVGRDDPALQIISSTRSGQTYYTAEFDTDRGHRWVTVNADGKVLSDVLDRNNAGNLRNEIKR